MPAATMMSSAASGRAVGVRRAAGGGEGRAACARTVVARAWPGRSPARAVTAYYSCNNPGSSGPWSSSSKDAARRVFRAMRSSGGRPLAFSGGFCYPGGGFWTSANAAADSKAWKELFRHLMEGVDGGAASPAADADAAASLPLDVVQDGLKYVVYADVPGLSKADLSIKLSKDGVLTISGTRHAPAAAAAAAAAGAEEGADPFLLRQRPAGAFERKWTLPEDADAAAVSAKVSDGVLAITVGKRLPEPEAEETQQDIPWV